MIKARGAKNKNKKKDGFITLKYIIVYMKIVFLWVLSWSAHPSLVRKCCSLRTSLSISNNTITLCRREFSLNIRGMTVIGTYSSKLDTVLYILCWHSTYPAMKQVLSYITYNNMECGENTHHGRWHTLTFAINKSLQEGVFQDQLKKSYIRPLLKKTLEKNKLKNYRPVSNLSFISKISEKVVASRLLSHMKANSMSNNLQSAHKLFHSTESALLKVENDVLLNMEKDRVTALTLLDLSAAFDTIDHLTLISRLTSWYGISGTALDWFSSYLSDQCQQVKM